jgi:hypothetical protein
MLSNLKVLAWQETIPMDVVIILQNSIQQKSRWAFSIRQVNSPHGNYAGYRNASFMWIRPCR